MQPQSNTNMEYHDMVQRWNFDDGPKFLGTHVIYREGDDYFSTELPGRFTQPEDLPIVDRNTLQKIPREHIWPLFEDSLTICPEPENPRVHVKQPRLTGYSGSKSLSSYLLGEAQICQILVKKPHRNIARYSGCAVKNGRITGLCFEKYAETLEDRLRKGHIADNESYVRQIRAGIDHLHSLNVVHNDIHMGNVMFANRDSDVPVIIDFDSCAIEGSLLPAKRGQLPEGARTAEFENDYYGLQILQKRLNKGEEGY
ncbi:hypothetical protein FE257_003796 [Aspergillus nanangensis]|uniref:Protein kinase domain-containing protein n=1 Tax=Aspergillus nanangensis TaxID=2582783 RepID=A0AAD4CBA1_ASPNN|nr:hypothetical protein FE257_003796 [Aspergillus nanangensis]